MKLSTPIPVRLQDDQRKKLDDISNYTGVDLSKLIRMAIKSGLPEIRKNFGMTIRRQPANTDERRQGVDDND